MSTKKKTETSSASKTGKKENIPEEERQGVGEFVFNENVSYKGGWILNEETMQKVKHGEGVYKDGLNVYEGEFEQDVVNGKGKMIWSNGCSYEGNFVKGKMEGFGVYTFPDKITKYEGEWVNNRMHGKGRYTSPDGIVWIGYFYNGKGEQLEREIN
ncbi:hypothetical protein ABK040_014015 [Willaertia magna]